MKEVLYLSHRIPYPPDKGDKIRSYNLLKQMSKRYTVHLATFVDDPADWQHTDALRALCGETYFAGLNPLLSRVKALSGLLTGSSLTMPYYRNPAMSAWIAALVARRNIDCVVAFSSSMAQYAVPLRKLGIRTVVDFCDMDSDKWRQYAKSLQGLRRWVYGREADKLRDDEAMMAAISDASVLISDEETQLFVKETGAAAEKVHTIRNGVDTAFFDPAIAYADPFDGDRYTIVFVGAMDYWPNIDAVAWFVNDVLPEIRAERPQARFIIVGSNPTAEVKALGRDAAVTVTGRVEDVRPYVYHAGCVVAPLRLARGVQNKVLEAMSMARPIVASPAALEGLPFGEEEGILVVTAASEWAGSVLSLLARDATGRHDQRARQAVAATFGWDASGEGLARLIAPESTTQEDAVSDGRIQL